MTDIVTTGNRIPAMTEDAISNVRKLEAVLADLPQVDIETEHVLHGGMYSRTICIPAGVALTGAFIRVPTLLVFSGHATVNIGEAVTIKGYRVLAASANRRQAFFAHADTRLTMVYATQAKTIADAEAEFTNEAHLMFSRKQGAINHINITGE